MRNCKEITRLISDSMDQKLSWSQRLELWFHTRMCGLCRQFRINAYALRRRIRQSQSAWSSQPETQESTESLPPDARQRIQSAIDQHRPS